MFIYKVSDKTDIMLGLQGIPNLDLDFRDFVQNENDFKQKSYMLQLQNQSGYFGYKIWASTGVKYDERKYSEKYREFENYKSSSTFVKVYLGW